MILNEKISSRIQEQISLLEEKGKLFSDEKLAGYYLLFRRKFGTEALSLLDGETLLSTMHDTRNRDSLVYWLEFKNDEELPYHFGSIAGGSGLKFGIYLKGETGKWMTGSSQKQVILTQEQAIQIARKHREQLQEGVKLLEAFPEKASNEDYFKLQTQLDKMAPDVSDTAWGHKYFSMMFPNKLEDYHNADYQRFHLMKMLQIPVTKEGRYSVSGQYMAIARELNIHINSLTRTLNEIHGSPYRYWSIKVNITNTGDDPGDRWEEMRDGGYVGIGWRELGDLSGLKSDMESRTKVKTLMLEKYKEKGGYAQEIFNFASVIQKGDVILATEKESRILGIGKVIDRYFYVGGAKCPNRVKVEWYSDDSWETPVIEIKSRVVKQLFAPENIVSTESRLLGLSPLPMIALTGEVSYSGFLGITARIHEVLERKKQIILYGPPGTGKTFWAFKSITDISSQRTFNSPYNELDDLKKRSITGYDQNLGFVRFCTFHPSYGYEDFIEGYRPISKDNELGFQLRSGIFKQLCLDAAREPNHRFYLIIDEINRGDIPRIFGELLTLLEKDKRKQTVILPLSGDSFYVPDNVYVVGTMNTADRSIALLDTALRRRFGFLELMPDISVFEDTVLNGIPLGAWLEALNYRILESIGRDARNLQIGHAYLLENGQPITDFARFVRVFREDIIPLLEEYCYEDYDALEKILGKGLIDREKQKIHHELFDENRKDDLIQALLEPAPEITTSPAILQEQEIPPEEEAEDQT